MGNGKPGSSGHGLGLSPSPPAWMAALEPWAGFCWWDSTANLFCGSCRPRAHPSHSDELLSIPAFHGSGRESHHRCIQCQDAARALSSVPGQDGCHHLDATSPMVLGTGGRHGGGGQHQWW